MTESRVFMLNGTDVQAIVTRLEGFFRSEKGIDDIDAGLLNYIDKYFKTVIINCKKRYYGKFSRLQKRGIVFVELEKYAENLRYDEAGFEKVICQYIDVQGIKIPVYNPELAEALLSLSETQRLVLIRNVVFDIPMKQIAFELGISKRMVEKHKHNALQAVRRMLNHNEN